MHEHPKDDPELLSEIEKLGYDPRDVDVSKTPMHAVFLYVGCAVSMGLAWVVMAVMDRSQVTVPEETAWERERMPEQPYPLLQSNITARTDIENLRMLEKAKTDHATWIDKEAGLVRIPIDAAMDLALEEGFETQAPQVDPLELLEGEEVMSNSQETEDVTDQEAGH